MTRLADRVLSQLHCGAMTPYQWVARSVGPRATRVVDIACADGGLARTLSRDGRLVVGVDLAPSSPGSGEVCWVRGDARRLPLADGGFDAVTSALGLAIIHPTGEWLAEAARVLRPGGLLCALAPTTRPLVAGDAAIIGQLMRILRAVPRLRAPLEATVRPVLAAHGLHMVGDGRDNFRFRVASRQDAELFLGAMSLPTTSRDRVVAAADFLEARVARGGELTVPVPLRRIVAIK